MVMKFMLLPWKPELVFTGLSIMGLNPQNLKFNSHVVSTVFYQGTMKIPEKIVVRPVQAIMCSTQFLLPSIGVCAIFGTSLEN